MLNDRIMWVFGLTFCLAAKCRCIPVNYDLKLHRFVYPANVSIRRILWYLSVILLCFQTIFNAYGLTHGIIQENPHMSDFSVQFLYFLVNFVSGAFQINTVFNREEVYLLYNQITFQHGLRSDHRSGTLTLFEKALMTWPMMACSTISVLTLIFLLSPTKPQFVYSLLPPQNQTVVTLVLFVPFEITSGLTWIHGQLFEYLFQLICFNSFIDSFRDLVPWKNCNPSQLNSSIRKYRMEWLLITKYNRYCSRNIASLKIATLMGGVIANVVLIKFHAELDFFALIMVLNCFFVAHTYPIILYDRAFYIYEYSNAFKQNALLCLSTYNNPYLPIYLSDGERKALRREIMSLPDLNIKVGGYYFLDTTETIVYLSLIANNTVNLLLSV